MASDLSIIIVLEATERSIVKCVSDLNWYFVDIVIIRFSTIKYLKTQLVTMKILQITLSNKIFMKLTVI